MLCGFCNMENYPGVSLDNYFLEKKMVCRPCLLTSIKKLKDDKIRWYNDVKVILVNQLVNNEIRLADTIMSYVITKDDIKDSHICSYCNKFIYEFHHNIKERFYYFVCGDCLSFNN